MDLFFYVLYYLGLTALLLSGFHAGYEYYGIRKQKKKELRIV